MIQSFMLSYEPLTSSLLAKQIIVMIVVCCLGKAMNCDDSCMCCLCKATNFDDSLICLLLFLLPLINNAAILSPFLLLQ